MNILYFAAVGLIGTIFAVFVKKVGEEYRIIVSVVCICSMIISVLPYLNDLFSKAVSFAMLSETSADNFMLLLKAVGVGYICQFTSDICTDAGETAIASKVELAGRIAILSMTVPVINSLVSMIEQML